ncbi:hypothetical protein JCM8208_003036 [Rhodotorula glutinis]
MSQGKCNCGSVRVELKNGLPDSSVLCHCMSCRASSGSLFTVNLVVKKEDLVFHGEEHIKEYADKNTDSGSTLIRRFCGTCGSPIVSVVQGHDEMQYLKGSLFGKGIPKPAAEIFSRNFESWESKATEGVHVCEAMPPN